MKLLSCLVCCSLLLALVSANSWDEERLQWLVVTPPNQPNVQLNCTSEFIYPFRLLNDSSIIGSLGSPVEQVWWVLPDGSRINDTYDDGDRRVVDRGVSLLVRQATDRVNGLYHCAVLSRTALNDTLIDWNSTTVYYYKRGLNLYGPDLYGGSAWEKYKRNTLIGSLTAGIFLLMIAGYALLNRFGILDKCGSSKNAVEAAPEAVEVTSGDPSAKANDAEMSPPVSVVQNSRASLRSRKSEKSNPAAVDAETAA